MSVRKTFNVRFLRVNITSPDGGVPTNPRDLFSRMYSQSTNGLCPSYAADALKFEIRDLTSHNNNAVFKGVFAVIRDDAPHIREARGGERVIPLARNEGILEKNHFIFYSSQSLIAYQINHFANHPSRLEMYLQFLLGHQEGLTLDEMLTRDAWDKLRRGVVKELQIAYDAPRDGAAYDPADFSQENLSLMQRSGASQIHVTLKAGRGQRGLTQWAKATARAIRGDQQLRMLRVKLGGESVPVDLIADVIKGVMEVRMLGKYPDSADAFIQLESAKTRAQAAIDAHLSHQS